MCLKLLPCNQFQVLVTSIASCIALYFLAILRNGPKCKARRKGKGASYRACSLCLLTTIILLLFLEGHGTLVSDISKMIISNSIIK